MTFPKCEDGYNKRKLTLFASQVVDDFKSLSAGPKKVVELTEDSPTIVLDNLDLANWKHITIYFLGVAGDYSSAVLYFNGDQVLTHYYTQLLLAGGTGIYATRLNQPIGPPPGSDATEWIMEVLFSGGRVRMWGMGDNNSPSDATAGMMLITYAPPVENLTSITFYSGDDTKPYKAGTRVEVW
jgi:hypothetical protein